MATLRNTEARLLTAPKIEGFAVQQWLPGKNRLDINFWEAARSNRTIKRWLEMGWIKIDFDEDMPDPTVPPSEKELAEFKAIELADALKNPTVPVQWHPALEGEIAKRKTAALAKRMPSKTPTVPKERKSLTGLRVEDALPLIAAESDIEMLEAWADADKRKTISEAVDERLADLALDEG